MFAPAGRVVAAALAVCLGLAPGLAPFACARAQSADSALGPDSAVVAPAGVAFPSGWYLVQRCEGGPSSLSAIHLTERGWVEVRGGTITRREASFARGRDAAVYEASFEDWVHVVHEGRGGGLDMGLWEQRAHVARLTRLAGGALELKITMTPATLPTQTCRLSAATSDERGRFELAMSAATDPALCRRAADCCRALGGPQACRADPVACRSWGAICSGAEADPQRCSSWLERVEIATERPRISACPLRPTDLRD